MNKFYYIPLYGLLVFSFNSFNGGLYAAEPNLTDSSSNSKSTVQCTSNSESTFLDDLIAVESSGKSFEGEKNTDQYVADDIDDDIHNDQYEQRVACSLFKKLKKGDRLLIDDVLGILEEISEESNKEKNSHLNKVYCALISFLSIKQWPYSSLAQAKKEKFDKDKDAFPTDGDVKEVLKDVVHKIIETKKKQQSEEDV